MRLFICDDNPGYRRLSRIVLEEGHLAESGTHEDLISSGGLYARLYALQERDPVQP